MDAYTIAGVQTVSTVIKDIRSQTINSQLTKFLLGGSGSPYNSFGAVAHLEPIIDFATGDLKTMLAAMTDQIALPIDSDFYIWFQKLAEGSVRSAGSTHYKGTIIKGMVIPVSLRLVHGDTNGAELTCQILLVSADGSTSPLTLAGTQALVAAAGASAGWTLGAVSINGTEVEGVEEVMITFGITPWKLSGSGVVYPTSCGVMSVKPTIRITANSIAEFLASGLVGAAQGATDSTITIQDLVEGGVRGSTPIVCTVDEGLWHPDTVNAQHGQNTKHSLILEPTYDGTNLPLAWSGLT